MARLALVAVSLLATATASLAQTYPSALPLTSAERRALELRLAAVLDYAQPGAIQRLELPGGGQAAVRPYNMVRTSNGQTCRGYRIDVDGQAGRSAVDGYRCRLSSGGSWVITEPETLITQSGPVDLQSQSGNAGSQFAEESRDPNALAATLRERLGRGGELDTDAYAREEREAAADAGPAPLFSPGEVPPVPREAPARLAGNDGDSTAGAEAGVDTAANGTGADDTGADDTGVNGGASDAAPVAAADPGQAGDPTAFAARDVTAAAQPGAPAIDARPVERSETPGEIVLPSTSAPAVVARIRTPADEQPTPTETAARPAEASPQAANAPADDGAARVVGERFGQASAEQSADGRVVAALKELDYLDPAAPTSADAVQVAIDDFARDERFALPVPSSALLARLNDALDRSGSLPACSATTTTMCLAR